MVRLVMLNTSQSPYKVHSREKLHKCPDLAEYRFVGVSRDLFYFLDLDLLNNGRSTPYVKSKKIKLSPNRPWRPIGL
jgi:hypothetical protein